MRTLVLKSTCFFIAMGAALIVSNVRAVAATPPSVDPAAPLPAPTPFFVRVGATAVIPQNVNAAVRAGGLPVIGGNGSVAAVPAAYVEAGYYLTNNLAASLAGGYPPTLTARGTGTLAPFNTMFKATVGLPVVAVTYHFDGLGPVRPYAGLGGGYAIVFDNKAASTTSPSLRDAPAFVLVGGIDYDLKDRWGLFVDVKKVFVTQRFTGMSAPFPGGPNIVPTTARIRTDPLLVTAGLSYRF